MIDSEMGSGEYFSELFKYDITSLTSPFSQKAYIEKIKWAEEAGYDILIIDSLSPAWTYIEKLKLQKTLSMNQKDLDLAWFEVQDQWEALLKAVFLSRCHVIVTLRSRSIYQILRDNGNTRAVRIGLDPICQSGIEYQFQVMFDLSTETHLAVITKDRLNLFKNQQFIITEETGEILKRWLLRKELERKFPQKEVLPDNRLSLMVSGREE